MDLHSQAEQLTNNLLKLFPHESKQQWANDNRFLRYQNDPIAFGRGELNNFYTEDVEKLLISVRDYQITVAISGNGTGKTHAAADISIWFYKCFPNSQVYTAAAPPEDNLRRLLWGEIGKRVNANSPLFRNDKLSLLNVGRSEWSFITGVTIPQQGTPEDREAKFSGKHAPYLCFIVDEGDAVPDEVFKGIDGCMSGGMTRLLVMFNPKKQSGWVYRAIRDGKANVVHLTAFNHPNVVYGRNIIPGAVTREKTVARINEMTIPLGPGEEPDADCFQVPDFLVGAITTNNMGKEYPPIPAGWRRIVESDFHYRVLGQYPTSSSNQLINREWINAARSRWDLWVAKYGEKPPEGTRPLLGHDVADEGDDFNTVCARYGGWVPRIRKWKGVDPLESAEKSVEIARELKAISVNVDSIGVGASVAPSLRKAGIRANKVMVSEKPTKKMKDKDRKAVFYQLRDQLWWEVREWLRNDPGSMLPPDEKLIEELSVATYEEVNGKIKIMEKRRMRKALGRSPDSAESLILTFAPQEPRPRARLI